MAAPGQGAGVDVAPEIEAAAEPAAADAPPSGTEEVADSLSSCRALLFRGLPAGASVRCGATFWAGLCLRFEAWDVGADGNAPPLPPAPPTKAVLPVAPLLEPAWVLLAPLGPLLPVVPEAAAAAVAAAAAAAAAPPVLDLLEPLLR